MPLRHLLPLGLALALFAIGQLIIPRGHSWGDDFALYITHAKNLVSGRDYGTLDHIRNPDHHIGPRIYPPGLPILLTLPYYEFGLDIPAMQDFMRLWYLGAIAAIFIFFYQSSSLFNATAITLLIAASPRLWWHSSEITPYGPHLLFLYLCLLFVFLANQSTLPTRRICLLYGTLTAICIYAATEFRTTGIILIPAILGSQIFLSKGRMFFAAYVCLLSIVTLWLTSLFLVDSDYADFFSEYDMHVPLRNALHFVAGIYWFFSIHTQEALRHSSGLMIWAIFIILIVNGLGVLGFATQVWHASRFSLFGVRYPQLETKDWFFVLYLIVIFIYPESQITYLIPIFPIMIYYVFEGIRFLTRRYPFQNSRLIWTLMLFILYIPPYIQLSSATFGQDILAPRPGIMKTEAVEMFDFVRQNTPADAVIMFRAPRALGLLTERKSSIWPQGDDPLVIWRYLQGIGATHVILAKEAGFAGQPSALLPGKVMNAEIRIVFENADFVVYQILHFR